MDGGMLSQDEINALLNGMNTSDNSTDEGNASTEPESGTGTDPAASDATTSDNSVVPAPDEGEPDQSLLSDMEKDAIGEVANISMGSAATTLYSLVNRKVNITTPVVSLAKWSTLTDSYERPCVFIQIKYTKGLDGSDILVLKEHDVKVITDLMMGGDGSNTQDELGELHLSAISEAMNQMMGASATSLSTMLGQMIDISPPEASKVDITQKVKGEDIAPFLSGTFVKITFKMQIDDLVDSAIMQLYPIDFAKNLCDTFMNLQTQGSEPEPQPEAAPQIDPQMAQAQPVQQMAQAPQMGQAPQMQQMAQPQPMPQMAQQVQQQVQQSVNIQPAQFQNFSTVQQAVQQPANIGLIMDVPLKVTVELGRTTKSISEILDFAPGTIIELDKIAGEPVDVLVNGKFVAKGEVVVIEESFGVRVTEIVK